MENEFHVLNSIEKNNRTTQRDIARNTGMSLGSVNVLIKRLVKKGMLKVEKLNPRTIQYILTPKGIKEKAELMYGYVVSSYRYINEINGKIDILLENIPDKSDNQIILYGGNDEICELLKNKLNLFHIHYRHIQTAEQLIKTLMITSTSHERVVNLETTTDGSLTPVNGKAITIVVWHPDYADALSTKNVTHINLLDIMGS